MHDEIVVLGGGWSVSCIPDYQQVLQELRGTYALYAANDAAYYSSPDVIVSMDRIWSETRLLQILQRHAILRQEPPEMWIREGIFKTVPEPSHDRLRFFRCAHSETAPMSHVVGVLNGNNSGVCALNLALQRRPQRVLMLGFDMQRGPQGQQHWYDDWTHHKASPGRMLEWAERFKSIHLEFSREGVELINVTEHSAIPAGVVPRWTYKKFLASL